MNAVYRERLNDGREVTYQWDEWGQVWSLGNGSISKNEHFFNREHLKQTYPELKFIEDPDSKARRIKQKRNHPPKQSSYPRDFQRQKMYRSEQMMRKQDKFYFDTFQEVQCYLNSITRSPWWKNYEFSFAEANGNMRVRNLKFNDNPTTIYLDGRPQKTRWAHAHHNAVIMGSSAKAGWAWNKIVILHELAHVGLGTVNGGKGGAHGPNFCRILLDMVTHFIGDSAADELREAFKSQRVKIGPSLTEPEIRIAANRAQTELAVPQKLVSTSGLKVDGVWRTARKIYQCQHDGCSHTIQIGHRYFDNSGNAGGFGVVRYCAECTEKLGGLDSTMKAQIQLKESENQ